MVAETWEGEEEEEMSVVTQALRIQIAMNADKY